MKHIAVFFVCSLLLSFTCEAATSQKKLTPSTSIKPINKAWLPLSFPQEAERLPVNYSGLDPVKFVQLFKSKVGTLKKDEFETTEQFAQRSANIDLILSPLNSKDLYAFQVQDVEITYNADTQSYTVGASYSYLCQDNYNFGNFKDWTTCKIAEVTRKRDTYKGSNAYGASIIVSRTSGSNLGLAFKKGSTSLSPFKKDSPYSDRYKYQDTLSVPLDRAKSLKNLTIGILFVGRITDAKLIEGRAILIEPKIDSPSDIFITQDAVPFELNNIIYYVVQTGEILGRKIL